MQKSTATGASFDPDSVNDPASAPPTGDADAVQKTTWVVGKGTDDRADRMSEELGEIGSDDDRDPAPRRGTAGSDDRSAGRD